MGEFVRVSDAAQIGEDDLAAFEVAGERIAVANVGGSFHAFGNTCTHRQCLLALGRLENSWNRSQHDAAAAKLLNLEPEAAEQ